MVLRGTDAQGLAVADACIDFPARRCRSFLLPPTTNKHTRNPHDPSPLRSAKHCTTIPRSILQVPSLSPTNSGNTAARTRTITSVHTSKRFLDQKISPAPLRPHSSTTTCPAPPTAPEEPPEQNGSGFAIQPINRQPGNTPRIHPFEELSSKSPAKSIRQLQPDSPPNPSPQNQGPRANFSLPLALPS
jgi:hypothetical protein